MSEEAKLKAKYGGALPRHMLTKRFQPLSTHLRAKL